MKNNLNNIHLTEEFNEQVENFKKITAKEIDIHDEIIKNKITTKEFHKVLENLCITNRHIKNSELFNAALIYNDKTKSVINSILSSFKVYKNEKLNSLLSELNDTILNKNQDQIKRNQLK